MITESVKHFPSRPMKPQDLDVPTPGDFLAHQFQWNEELLGAKPGQAPPVVVAAQPWRRRLVGNSG
jgi:hypothetical protein